MVTIREIGIDIVNDINLGIVAQHHLPMDWIRKYFKIKAGETIYPGSAFCFDTGSGGEPEVQECVNGSGIPDGWVDLDTKQVDDCEDVYTAGDLVPCILRKRATGCVLRNIRIDDPNAALDLNSFYVGGASGTLALYVAPTMVDLSTTSAGVGFPTGATLGGNGALILLDRIVARNQNYRTDPGAAATVVIEVW